MSPSSGCVQLARHAMARLAVRPAAVASGEISKADCFGDSA